MESQIVAEIKRALLEDRNIVLHGPGGTGKTYSVVQLTKALEKKGVQGIFITALTGVAAIELSRQEIKAKTLHSFAGIFTGEGDAITLAQALEKDYGAKKRWKGARILVIDEFSMLNAELFEKLDYIGRHLREEPDKVFGGIRLIFTGDLLQLPPVSDELIIKSKVWNSMDLAWFELTVPKRYQDLFWFQMLLRIRNGKPTEADWQYLETRHTAYLELVESAKDKGFKLVMPTQFFPKNINVDAKNRSELELLPGKSFTFTATYTHTPLPGRHLDRAAAEKILENTIPRSTTLKVGAQVMLKFNLDLELELANGSRGVVMSINSGVVLVKFRSGLEQPIVPAVWENRSEYGISKVTQIPLVLAWATTAHKAQGSTLDAIVVDIGPDIFADGQAYVVLSRVRDPSGLFISNISRGTINANQEVLGYLKAIKKYSPVKKIAEFVEVDPIRSETKQLGRGSAVLYRGAIRSAKIIEQITSASEFADRKTSSVHYSSSRKVVVESRGKPLPTFRIANRLEELLTTISELTTDRGAGFKPESKGLWFNTITVTNMPEGCGLAAKAASESDGWEPDTRMVLVMFGTRKIKLFRPSSKSLDWKHKPEALTPANIADVAEIDMSDGDVLMLDPAVAKRWFFSVPPGPDPSWLLVVKVHRT